MSLDDGLSHGMAYSLSKFKLSELYAEIIKYNISYFKLIIKYILNLNQEIRI